MPNPFEQFLTDTLTLLKTDGTVHENIPAAVGQKGIVIQDDTLPIEVGDKLIRRLPNGLEDVFIVDDPGYHPAFHSIPSGFQIRYHRADRRLPTHSVVTTYEVSGTNARVNINSQDYSTNTFTDPTKLFSELRCLVDTSVAASHQEAIRAAVDAMESTQGTPAFIARYTHFVGVIADHLTVFGPLLPALTRLLQ